MEASAVADTVVNRDQPSTSNEEDFYSHAMQIGASMLESDLKKREEENSSLLVDNSVNSVSEETMEQSEGDSDNETEEEEYNSVGELHSVKKTNMSFHDEPIDMSGQTFNMEHYDSESDLSSEPFNASLPGGSGLQPESLETMDSDSYSGSFGGLSDAVSGMEDQRQYNTYPGLGTGNEGGKSKGAKYFCEECQYPFKCLKSLQNHRRVKHPLQCQYCEKLFGSQNKLASHISCVHDAAVSPSGAKLYPCPVCGKCLSTAGSRTKHMRLHTGLKPYTCEVCGKKFSQIGHLYAHMRAHTGSKPFACLYCPKLFTEKSSATRHMRKVHEVQAKDKEKEKHPEELSKMKVKTAPLVYKNFSCQYCGKKFVERSSVRRHLRRIHTTKVSEDLIKQAIGEVQDVPASSLADELDDEVDKKDYDVRNEAFCCKFCGKLYRDRSSVQRHLRKHHGIEHGHYDGLYTIQADDVQFDEVQSGLPVVGLVQAQANTSRSTDVGNHISRQLTDAVQQEGIGIEDQSDNGEDGGDDDNGKTLDNDSEDNIDNDVNGSVKYNEQSANQSQDNEIPNATSGSLNVVRIKTEPPDYEDENAASKSPALAAALKMAYLPGLQKPSNESQRSNNVEKDCLQIKIKTEPGLELENENNSAQFQSSLQRKTKDYEDRLHRSEILQAGNGSVDLQKNLHGFMNADDGNDSDQSGFSKEFGDSQKIMSNTNDLMKNMNSWGSSHSSGSHGNSNHDNGAESDDSDKTVDFDVNEFRPQDQSNSEGKDVLQSGDYSKDMALLDEELRKALMPQGSGLIPDSSMAMGECGISAEQMLVTNLTDPSLLDDKSNDGQRPTLRCNQCDKVYNNWKSYRQHRRAKHPLTCELCKKRFSEQKDFDAHMRGHYGLGTGKNYSCPVCGKFIKDASSRAKHMRLHTGEKPYKCEICDKRFTQTGHLQSHMRIHNGERPFDCKLCGKFFSERSSVKRHLRKIHFKDYNKKCEKCGIVCATREEYREHIQSHNPDIYSCEICQKDFPDSKRLKLHKYNAHSKAETPVTQTEFPCNACDKVFMSSKGLRNHSRKHVDGVESFFKCGICEKTFTSSVKLEKHMITHVEKKYICLTCNKVFRNAAAFSVHKKKHLIAILQKGDNPEDLSGSQLDVDSLDDLTEKDGHGIDIDQLQENTNLEVDQIKANTSSKDLKLNVKQASNSTGVSVLNPDSVFDFVVGGNIVDGTNEQAAERNMEEVDTDQPQSSQSLVNVFHKTPSRQLTVHCCNVCGMYMTSKAHLRRHIEGVHGEKIHKCSECNAVFASIDLLRLHKKRIHRQNKTFQCNICSKHFKDKSVLRIHLRVHADVRPYTCEICSKGFTAMYALKHHMEVHTGGSKKCPKCNTKFLHHRSYELHVKANCVGRRRRPKLPPVIGQIPGRTLRCQYCTLQFTYQESLTEHIQQEHSGGEDGVLPYSVVNDVRDDNKVASSFTVQEETGSSGTDYEVLKQNFPTVFPVDETGNMVGNVPDNHSGEENDSDMKDSASAHFEGNDTEYSNFEVEEDSTGFNGQGETNDVEILACSKCGAEFEDASHLAIHSEECSNSRRRKRPPMRRVPMQNNDFLEHLDVNML